jgi:hypothetical protein
MRCEGAQQTRYALCAAVPCAVGQANQLLDADQTIDIPVNCNANALAVGAKRYLSLTTDDAGLPSCKAQHSPF